MLKTVKLFGLNFSSLTMTGLLRELELRARGGRRGYVVTPNVDHLVILRRDAVFERSYQNADFILADGAPIIFVSRILGTAPLEKISGSDLFTRLLPLAEKNGLRIFLLGAREEVNRRAAEKIRRDHPGLNVAGRYAPPLGFENDKTENQKAIRLVNQADPDFLFIFLGTPKQEKWVYLNSADLKFKMGFCFGAALDFYSGLVRRAPRWMQRGGLEWLWRLAHDPPRLMKRYLIDDFLPFVWISGREIAARAFRR